MKTNVTSTIITPRETRSIQKHLSEICNKKYDVLSIDEEVELATRSRNGDLKARNELVEHNMRLAITIAKLYQNQGVELEDLIVAAEMGLIAAAEQFDPTVGVKFISYACHHIRREITDTLTRDARTIRLPQNVVTKTRLLKRAIVHYQMEHNAIPTDEELAKELDMDIDDVHNLRSQTPGAVSMDTPLGDESNDTIGSMLTSELAPTDAGLIDESMKTTLKTALESLSERDAEVVRRSFGLNGEEESIDQIAVDMGLSRERIRQIREIALRKIRSTYGEQLLSYRA